MKAKNRARAVEALKRCSGDVILAAAGHCDGHTILDPKAFLEAGLPKDVVELLTTAYRSDGSPKGTIFVDGKAVDKVRGVYGLDLLRFMASALDVEYRRAMGRGFEAANIRAALQQHLKPSGGQTPE